MADPAELQAHPRNWRRHPQEQREAMEGVLDSVGWIQDVIVNRRTGRIVDGHLRVSLAIARGEKEIPVKYVDLSEAEEAQVLATFDPLGDLAEADDEALRRLLEETGAAAEQLAADGHGEILSIDEALAKMWDVPESGEPAWFVAFGPAEEIRQLEEVAAGLKVRTESSR